MREEKIQQQLSDTYRSIRMIELRREAELRFPQEMILNIHRFRVAPMVIVNGEMAQGEIAYTPEERGIIDEANRLMEMIHLRYYPELAILYNRMEQLREMDSEGEVSYA